MHKRALRDGKCFKGLVGGGLGAVLVLGMGVPAWSSSTADESAAAQEEHVTVVADAAEIDQARADASDMRGDGVEPGELKDLRTELAEAAAQNGETLLPRDTEAFELTDEVQIAIPEDMEIKSVEVAIEDDRAVAEVVTETGSEGAAVQGQGMGWEHKGSDTFIIKLTGKGEMESRYIKERFIGEGPDLMSMRRKGQGRGYEVSGYNWSVTGLYISSHVIDSDKQWVNGRYEAKPASDQNGDCDDLPFSLNIKGLGWAFKDCDEIDIAWVADNPGYYRAYMKQGASFSKGDREVGFHNVIKVDAGKTVNYTHYQRLEMARFVYPADKCSSWDENNTCTE